MCIDNQNILPIDEMRTLVLKAISYDQLADGIAAGSIRGTIAQLNQIVDTIVHLQYQTGNLSIDGIEVPFNDVAHRVLQANRFEIELTMLDMMNCRNPHPKSCQNLIHSLYSTVGSLRAYQYQQCRQAD